MSYGAFLASKTPADAASGFTVNPDSLSDRLFDWQREVVTWALARGRAAIFAGTGLGKTAMQLQWAQHVANQGRPVLILAPLAVSAQTAREGEKFDVPVTVCREAEDARAGVNVVNYERLDRFDAEDFGGLVRTGDTGFDTARRMLLLSSSTRSKEPHELRRAHRQPHRCRPSTGRGLDADGAPDA